MAEVLDRRRPVKTHVINRAGKIGTPALQDSPYERARKRLEALTEPDASPKPPPEVLALRSTRALEDWEDLMLTQDVELWGASDLSVAAQYVCMQELCRDLQFRVQTLGELTEYDHNGNRKPNVHYMQWQQTLSMVQRLHQSIGSSERSVRDANRRAKKAIKTGTAAVKKAMESAAPEAPPPLAGTDISA